MQSKFSGSGPWKFVFTLHTDLLAVQMQILLLANNSHGILNLTISKKETMCHRIQFRKRFTTMCKLAENTLMISNCCMLIFIYLSIYLFPACYASCSCTWYMYENSSHLYKDNICHRELQFSLRIKLRDHEFRKQLIQLWCVTETAVEIKTIFFRFNLGQAKIEGTFYTHTEDNKSRSNVQADWVWFLRSNLCIMLKMFDTEQHMTKLDTDSRDQTSLTGTR